MPRLETPSETVRFGAFELNLRARELRRNGILVKLSGQPFEILALLLERPGDVVTRKELQDRLWPADTFVDFEHGMNNAIKKLRTALGDDAEHPLYVETLARVGYRFIAPAERVSSGDYQRREEGTSQPGAIPAAEVALTPSVVGAEKTVPPSETTATPPRHAWPVRPLGLGIAIASGVLLIALVGLGVYRSRVARPALGESGTVVVADFVNTTGDPVFDVTLRKGVEVDLSQSPFLEVLPRPRIWKSLEMMGRLPDEKLTDKTGLEVCQRANARALLAGSIVGLGQHFVITIDALDCRNGDSLALEQVQAESKEAVLRSLGEATTRLRGKLGESLGSLQQFGTRLEQATTGSLDALKAFSLGDEQRARGKNAEAIPFYQHAIDLDPGFALAYARIGAVYYNIYEFARAREYLSKAFEMRPRVSERERLYLSARYYENVTGERPQTIESYELWRQLYPHDWIPANNLTNVYTDIGQYDKAIPPGLDAVRLNPDHGFPYAVLARAYKRSGRYVEAKAICEQAINKRLDGWSIHSLLYQIAYAGGDAEGTRRQLEWAKGTSDENEMLSDWASGEAGVGHIRTAAELYGRARDAALQRGLTESAAIADGSLALVEAVVGHSAQARSHAASSLRLSKDSGPTASAVLALAYAGDSDQAERQALEYEKRWPLDTIVVKQQVPMFRAAIETRRNNPQHAVELLREATPYEFRDFDAVFVRGLAYLRAERGREAAGEFQKILDHQGVDPTSVYIPLARLGSARARTLAGDNPGARSAYQQFLSAWKDADPDLPVLQEARREFEALSAGSLSR